MKKMNFIIELCILLEDWQTRGYVFVKYYGISCIRADQKDATGKDNYTSKWKREGEISV